MKRPRARKSKKPARKPAKRRPRQEIMPPDPRRAAAGQRIRARDVRRLPKPSNHFAHDLHASPLGSEPLTGSSPPPERGEMVHIYPPAEPAPAPEVSLAVLRQWADDIRFREPEVTASELLAALPREEATELVRTLATFLARVYTVLSEDDAARLRSA
jgi:hypothetical protein